ncbi:hypothetical protein HV032_05995 [Citrobacter freundii]|nr:hypothetical protein HV032_05995 [Citrobacter freundii]
MKMAMEMVGLGAIAAYLGKDGLAKLLGPTADYLGGELRDFAQKRVENVGKIFANASQKISEEKESSGSVPPKVLRSILNEGSYSTDGMGVEYFGGILASSKSEEGRDDRGARLALKVASLTVYQLRAHYLLYYALTLALKGKNLSFYPDRKGMQTFVTMNSFLECMDFSKKEYQQIDSLFSHIFSGLNQEGLIEQDYSYGQVDFIKTRYPKLNESGVLFIPTLAGVELFLWAFGYGEKHVNYFFDSEFSPSINDINCDALMAKALFDF